MCIACEDVIEFVPWCAVDGPLLAADRFSTTTRRKPSEWSLMGGGGLQVKGKADDLYRGSVQFENHRRTALQYPLVHWTLCRCQQYGAFSMKALARYQIILLGEQRHIRCEQLAQGCCPNNAAVGVEPATSWSRVQRPTTRLPGWAETPCYFVGPLLI